MNYFSGIWVFYLDVPCAISLHSMDTKFPNAIMPIAFMLLFIYVWLVLLFVYVFGIAIKTLAEILL
jgi:hypothetical protein